MVARGGKGRETQGRELRCAHIRAAPGLFGKGVAHAHRGADLPFLGEPWCLTPHPAQVHAAGGVYAVWPHAPGDRVLCPALRAPRCPLGLTFFSSQARNMPVWLPGQDQPLLCSNRAIRVGDKGWWSPPARRSLRPAVVTLTLVGLAEGGTPFSSGSLFQAAG